jgi:hypothetical protein
MARKRTKEAADTDTVIQGNDDTAQYDALAEKNSETSFNPSEFDPARPEAPASDPSRSPEEPAAAPARSFVEAVDRKKPEYVDQGPHDKIAGVKLLEHRNPFLTVVRFDEKPSVQITRRLREAKFEWVQANGEWIRPIRFDSRAQDRIDAERVYKDVCQMIRTERGVNHTFG